MSTANEPKNKRVVVKVGSHLALNKSGLDVAFLNSLCVQLNDLQTLGYIPIVVLSGAVALGKILTSLTRKSAQAAVGQQELISRFGEVAKRHDLMTAQLLISRGDIINRARNDALGNTMGELIASRIVPIVNENDATALSHRPDFEDNDQLAVIVAIIANTESVVIMTNVDGVFTANPETTGSAKLIQQITNINLEIIKQLGQGKNEIGRGGMAGKLRAARLATAIGITVHIISGHEISFLTDIIERKKNRGTVCLPRGTRLDHIGPRDRWILSAHNSGASVQVDRGAATALRQNKSLLAVGVIKVFGQFESGDSIELVDDNLEAIALGLASISKSQLEQLLRMPDKQYNREVVHIDNMRLL